MIKFIIALKNNRLYHYKSDWLSHDTIARDNLVNWHNVIEAGLIIDKRIFILDCQNKLHLIKKPQFFNTNFMQYRETETRYIYKNAFIRQGD